jgi:hypothetical protein
MTFLPHVVLAALIYMWARGEERVEGAILVVAALLPFWAIWRQRAHSLGRAFLLGPVTALAIAVGAWIAWDADERDWLMKILAAFFIGTYVLYCLVVFAIAAWWRRRRSKTKTPPS